MDTSTYKVVGVPPKWMIDNNSIFSPKVREWPEISGVGISIITKILNLVQIFFTIFIDFSIISIFYQIIMHVNFTYITNDILYNTISHKIT